MASIFHEVSQRSMAQVMLARLPRFLALGFLLATPLEAEVVTCSGDSITVQNAGERAETICEAATEALEQLASCNLTVTRPIAIEIADTLSDGCYGLYHCDDHLIQLHPLEDYANHLASGRDGPFGHLEPDVFFESVLRHELAHSALRTTPCPYKGCPVTREFVAYTMQIRFLSDADRAPFDQVVAEAGRAVTPDDLSIVGLMMVRDAFINNAYLYLTQQNDPCEYIGRIARGDIILDRPVR